jgi:hypothetical protein
MMKEYTHMRVPSYGIFYEGDTSIPIRYVAVSREDSDFAAEQCAKS